MKDTFANYDLGMKPEKQKLSNFIVTCSLLKKKKNIFSKQNKFNLHIHNLACENLPPFLREAGQFQV